MRQFCASTAVKEMELRRKSYEMTLKLDKYAPTTVTQRCVRKSDVWFNLECREEKRRSRRLERRFKSEKGGVTREGWLAAQKDSHSLFNKTKSSY